MIRAAGIEPMEVIASGGGFASPLWTRMHAEAFGLPLRVAETSDGAARGAAILAAIGAGACDAAALRPEVAGRMESPGNQSQTAFWNGLMTSQALLQRTLNAGNVQN
jgi:sugar (pentulose or hexulose) kinase